MRPVARSGEEDGRDPDVDEAEFVAESIKRNTIRLFFILLSQLSRIDLHIQMCEEVFPSDWWTGTYLEGLTLPRDLRQRGTLGGPHKKKIYKCSHEAGKCGLLFYAGSQTPIRIGGSQSIALAVQLILQIHYCKSVSRLALTTE
jgi:hypothetical protein